MIFLLGYMQKLFIGLFFLSMLFRSTVFCEKIVHTTWGFWDKGPMPTKAFSRIYANARKLQAKLNVHSESTAKDLAERYSREHNCDLDILFSRIPRPVAKTDIARYLLIYYLGGIYMDIDVQIKDAAYFHKIPPFPNGIWFTEMDRITRWGPREKKYPHRIAQYVFYIPDKEGAVLREILQESIKRMRILFKEKKPWTDVDVLWATGPDVVTTVLHETHLKGFYICPGYVSRKILTHLSFRSWSNSKDTR